MAARAWPDPCSPGGMLVMSFWHVIGVAFVWAALARHRHYVGLDHCVEFSFWLWLLCPLVTGLVRLASCYPRAPDRKARRLAYAHALVSTSLSWAVAIVLLRSLEPDLGVVTGPWQTELSFEVAAALTSAMALMSIVLLPIMGVRRWLPRQID